MTEECTHFKEFLASERKALRKALDEHQERLSKKLGRKTTKSESEADFIDRKVWRFATEFRRKYCLKCPDRAKCVFQKLKLKKKAKRVGIIIGKTVRSSLRKRRSVVKSTKRK